MNSEWIVNGLMVVMVLGSLFLAVASYVPRFSKMLTPSWSTQFFSTVIVVIASKLITLYVVLTWLLTAMQGTQHTFFIWGYFLCMFFGIYVYFNFGSSERERANVVRILENKGLAVLISLGILLFYSFCTATAYSYWTSQPDKTVFLNISQISVVDFFFFSLLWLRYWLTRDQVTKEAQAYQKKNPK
jgi:glucan phosphoethanolaminetransferase (alkaline phosphatase superfamily)